MKRHTFDFLMDPGHGWIKVPKKMVADLGIADKISRYSYQRGAFAYLEEDMDAGTFIKAYKAKFGDVPKFRERNSNKSSRIRNYETFSA